MYKLKLIKALSYNGKVQATAEKPFVAVDAEEDADYLVNTGLFELIGKVEKDSGEKKTTDVDKMKKTELEAFAAENGIDISDCTNNDEKKAKIKAALAEDNEDGGEVDFGED